MLFSVVTFGEVLGHVITLCGQILVSRTDDPLPPHRVSILNVPVCTFKTSPCVRAPRAHVLREQTRDKMRKKRGEKREERRQDKRRDQESRQETR